MGTILLATQSDPGADRLRVDLFGELDAETAATVERELREAEHDARAVVVDLAGVRALDESGLDVLRRARERARLLGCDFSVERCGPEVRDAVEGP